MSAFILASGSESRRAILHAAGVPFTAETPDVDESAIKAALAAACADAEAVAMALAEAKAMKIAARHSDALVLGCDQVLLCGGRLFDKARAVREAREILLELRGREHELATAMVLVRGGIVLWKHIERLRLWMREFSEAFLDAYLVDEAEHILSAVGCYRIEGRGAQLFSRIEGDQFAIRGLPLFPLLDELRRHRLVAT